MKNVKTIQKIFEKVCSLVRFEKWAKTIKNNYNNHKLLC